MANPVNTGSLSSAGVGSGLDVDGIVTKLIAVESRPLAGLGTREAKAQAQISAYGSLKGALAAFQGAAAGLAKASAFQSLAATASDPDVLAAVAGPSAAAGSYAIEVARLAQAQSLYAAGQAGLDTPIGSGAASTLYIDFGSIAGGSLSAGVYSGASFTQDATQASASITIDSSNNTLSGIRDAINAAGAGVSASIVGDGGALPYHLVLSAGASGAAHAMRVTVTGDAALQSLLGYDPAGTQNLTQSAAAQDAALTINGLGVTSPSNAVSGAIQGVTLQLAGEGDTTLQLARNAASIQSAVAGFVQAYNQANGTLATLTAYDPVAKQGGPLLGDATVARIQAALRAELGKPLAGGASQLSVLSQAGVSFQKDGSLALDPAKLQQAIASNAGDLAKLFAAVGTTSDTLVGFVASSGATQAGAHTVAVSALATHGAASGSLVLGASTLIDAGNNRLSLSVDGVAATVTLASGSYTPTQLAAQLQAAINASATFSGQGIQVSVAQSGGALTVTSASYGSASTVALGGGNALAALFGAVSAAAGANVAGTIDGAAATGSGQILAGAAGSAAEGMKLLVAGGALGSRGTVTLSRGAGDRLSALLEQFLASDGAVSSRTEGLGHTVEDIGRQREALNRRLETAQARYRAQFAALDSMLTSLNSTSSFLKQQLSSLSKSTSSD